MALAFFSTTPGTSSDYRKYLYDVPTKQDRDGDAILLDFTLAATDSDFVKLNRGNYVKFTTATYPIWYTGYITNEPDYTYLGESGGVPYWGYRYEASSDEIILSQNSLGFIPPFINMTQGAILRALAEIIAPGLFDYTNIDGGLTLARYVVDPTKKFSDVVKDFAEAAVFRFYGQDHKLYFTAKDELPQALTIDGAGLRFSPHSLEVKASTNSPIINDVVVIGDIEPQNYVKDYFAGTGFDGDFALSSSVYGISSALLLDDTFSGTTLDSAKWTEYDQPTDYIQLLDGYCNFLGGSGDGSYDVHLDSSNLIPLSGNIRLTHGDFDFVPQASDNLVCGVIAGLWTQAPNSSYTGCAYGIRVKKTSGVVTLTPIANGAADESQSVTVDPVGNGGGTPATWDSSTTYTVGQKARYSGVDYEALATTLNEHPDSSPQSWALMTAPRYVIRTVFSTQRVFRMAQRYSYLASDGSIASYGGGGYDDTATATTYITEIDPNTGRVTEGWPVVWSNTWSLPSNKLWANYVPGASNNLHMTVTNLTISTPMQAALAVKPSGEASFVGKIVGPNEVDSSDGLSPYATITEAGGTSQKQNILGTPKYHAGDPRLTFFKDSNKLISTIPQKGDIVRLSYRSAGAAIGRARDTSSIVGEAANWGDSGIRSVVRADLKPLPITSEDCEAAAASIVGENSYTHYEGKYTVPSQNVTNEPLSGSILPFVNLPSGVFVATAFQEPVSEVTTTFDASRAVEVFTHTITFGLKGDSQRLREQLKKFAKQTDVFSPQDSAEVPTYVAVESIGTAYAPDIPNLELDFDTGHSLGVDTDNLYFKTNQAPPVSGGFEVRYSDSSWGVADSKNLALRTTSQTFSLPRIKRNSVIFVKAYDGDLYSRYAASIRCGYPGIPEEPTAAIGGNFPTVSTSQTINQGGYTSQGLFDGAITYGAGDVVTHAGSSYVATTPTTGNLPTDPAYWQLLASAGTSGSDGLGVPAGGTTGQVLAKIDGTDNNTEWVDQTGGASLPTESGNKVLASPADGSSAVVSARALVGADLPDPSSSTKGGVKSKASEAHKYVTQLGTDGSVSLGQPNYTDLAGTPVPPPGATVSTTNESFTAGETKNYSLTMAKTFSACSVAEATGKKFRLRLYSTSAARTADASRGFTIPLALGSPHGCILDLMITQVSPYTTPWMMTPLVGGSNSDDPRTATIYAAVTSFETSTQNVQVTISFTPSET